MNRPGRNASNPCAENQGDCFHAVLELIPARPAPSARTLPDTPDRCTDRTSPSSLREPRPRSSRCRTSSCCQARGSS